MILPADTCDTADLTLLERMYFDVLNDGRDESIELYTSAERCPDSLMGWDTGQRWLLLVRNEDKVFPLFDDWVQYGQIEFSVVAFNNFQVAGPEGADLETHIYVMQNGQSISLFDCYWDKKNQYFKKRIAFNPPHQWYGKSSSKYSDYTLLIEPDHAAADSAMQIGRNKKSAPDQKTILQKTSPLAFDLVKDLTSRKGYDWGAMLESNDQKTVLLLYNENIGTKDDLKAKMIELNHKTGNESAWDVYLPDELHGYSFVFKFGNAVQKKHLLGIRSKIEPFRKKLYSDLLVMDKDNLQQMKILQSYALNFDSPAGKVPQGVIPTTTDFTLELIDDYIVYQDADLFWKVQDVRSGTIYSSNENETSLNKMQIYYQQVEKQDELVSGQYIYILKYISDGSVLAFDAVEKTFLRLKI